MSTCVDFYKCSVFVVNVIHLPYIQMCMCMLNKIILGFLRQSVVKKEPDYLSKPQSTHVYVYVLMNTCILFDQKT